MWATGVVPELIAGELTEHAIGLAIEVHRHTGRGLLESVYGQCLCHELRQAGIPCERQVPIPVLYKGLTIGEGFRADIVVAREVIVEINAVAAILPAHQAQLHTCLSMNGIHAGLILNCNASRLVDGIRRYVVEPAPEGLLRLPWRTVALVALRAILHVKCLIETDSPGPGSDPQGKRIRDRSV